MSGASFCFFAQHLAREEATRYDPMSPVARPQIKGRRKLAEHPALMHQRLHSLRCGPTWIRVAESDRLATIAKVEGRSVRLSLTAVGPAEDLCGP